MKAEETVKTWETSVNILGDPEAVENPLGEGSIPGGEPMACILNTTKPLSKESLVMRILLCVLALLTGYAFLTLDSQGVNIPQALANTLKNFSLIFFQPFSKRLTLWNVFAEVGMTLGLAFLTTLFSGLISLFLGLLAAQNLAPKRVTDIVKAIVALVRAIPTIIWVLIFAVAAGLGSTAAVIGLTFHSVSYLTKAYSESFENLDKSVIEALKASGANWWQIVFQAVIPSSATYLLSWTFVRFEINFGNAIAMGAAAGANGIGFDLFMASGFYFDLHEIGLITYFLLAFAIVLEIIATNMKRKIA